MRSGVAALAGVGLALAAGTAPAAAAAPVIHAHRGGSLLDGVPTFPEETMPAFRNTVRTPGVWLELDAVVSRDGVPFVIHDSTLDRTTDCTGVVGEKTAAEIERCRTDVLGTAGRTAPAPPSLRVPLPRLSEVLAFAKERGVGVNVEIKYLPGDPTYVPGDRSFADDVMDVVVAARLDRDKLIVQSFEPNNLEVARDRLPGVQLSFLTLAQANAGGPAFAAARGFQWVSPGGVPDAAYVRQAHGLGLKVVPYTLNDPDAVRRAAAAGVDALITDDVPMARTALGLGPTPPPSTTFPRRSVRFLERFRGLPALLRAGGATNARITARLGSRRGRVVAAGSVQLARPGAARALVPLTDAGRRLVAGRGRAVTLVVTTVYDGAPSTTRRVGYPGVERGAAG